MRAAGHGPMCSLLFQTPACTQPALLRPSHGVKQHAAVPRQPAAACGAEMCSLAGPGPSSAGLAAAAAAAPASAAAAGRARTRTRTQATTSSSSSQASTRTATAGSGSSEGWWKKQADLWVDVHTDEDFYREIDSGDKLVFVDFFATWCNGCQRSYPELCKIAADPEMAKHFKFVKVCIEELKKASRDEGVKALPFAQVYRPGVGKLVGLDVPPSKVKHLRHNLQILLHNPGMGFRTDPNGFVVPVKLSDAELQQQRAARKAAEAAQLAKGQGGLFAHLLGNVLGEKVPAAAAGAAAEPPPPQQQQQQASSNGDGNGGGDNGSAALAAELSRLHAARELQEQQQQTQQTQTQQQASAALQCDMTPQTEEAREAKARFLARHGHEYGYGGLLDQLYPCEVGCRMRPGEHYLDYTGSGVYCQSQVERVFDELRAHMFGNPHSANPSSSMTGDRVEEVRDLVLKHFNADPAEYQVVFTRSATGALQLVGETFPWSRSSTFAYLRENHNSVLGMREYALEAGGGFKAVNESYVEAWVADQTCGANLLQLDGPDGASRHHRQQLQSHRPGWGTGADEAAAGSSGGADGGADGSGGGADPEPGAPVYNLFAFPAEDNFAGVKYPLRWIEQIKAKSTDAAQWRVLVDAAAFVPTQPLDLRAVRPDFVAMSFYKMFGYPTGLGALIVRVDAADVLRKLFWGGGAVSLATSSADFHVLKCRPADKLEDGTVNFLDIIALKHGFGMIERLGGIKAVQRHVAALTEHAYARLSSLRHSNGRPMLQLFGKHHLPNAREVQGGILNFEVLRPDGSVFSYKTFEREAAAAGFHVRTGAECNPGACYSYLGVREEEVEGLAGKKEGCHDDVEFITVQRNRTLPAGSGGGDGDGSGAVPPAALPSAAVLDSLATTSVDLGHPAEVASQWVEVPLGSVRASLGYMSTWEDVHALAGFIETNYKDRTA